MRSIMAGSRKRKDNPVIGEANGTIGTVVALSGIGRANGLTKTAVVKALVEGLNATTVKPAYNKDLDEWRYSDPLPDVATRVRTAIDAIKVMGWMPSEKQEVAGTLKVVWEDDDGDDS